MPRFRPVEPNLQKYCARIGWRRWLIFWSVFVFETLTQQRLSRLVAARAGRPGSAQCDGLENLPANGSFVLAVNHYRGFLSLDVIAAVLSAANLVRPDLADNYLVITGRRARAKPPPPLSPARLMRRIVDFAFRRWAGHLAQIALGNSTASIQALRDWRKRAQQQAVLVFPEGKARLQFGRVRTGAGRWLTTLHTPIVPVGVWWCDGWHIRFGPPLRWSHRSELRDVQLGLAIATLLPPELAPDWQAALTQWRAAHNL